MKANLKKIQNVLTGQHKRLNGDCSELSGNCSGLSGDLDNCEISEDDRAQGVNILDLIKE